jgi:hypothetical protein
LICIHVENQYEVFICVRVKICRITDPCHAPIDLEAYEYLVVVA